MPAATVLEMGTLGGARALGPDREIGSLEVGKRADIVLVNLKNLHSMPQADPVSTLVYSARSADVETCRVDGRILMKDKELLSDSSLVTADSGYHSEHNLKQLQQLGVAALIADTGMRKRD